ncbi:hydrolase [Thalassotalea aquiviva]|uniref:hydrolase n=1 Tax=Thalassotalea aquiviva TaxID=3242415 RepID=UPI00352AE32D
MKKSSTFKPAWWLNNPHLQTMAPKLIRNKQRIKVDTETIELPDGDFLDLAWTADPKEHPNKPIVMVLHGLEGSINSPYAKGMMNAISQRNWIGVLMHFRGCSGRPNRQSHSYHSGDTWDLHYCSHLLHQRHPNHPKGILGFSLGGNVLTRYLAEEANNPFNCAAVICAPLHLQSCSQRISRGFSKVYQRYLINMLKSSALQKIDLQLLPNYSKQEIKGISTLYEFDSKITAPINGFDSAEDYYHKASGMYVIDQIVKPTLFIHAKDDPFLSHQEIEDLQINNPNISFEISHGGGHVGFISGRNPFKPEFWLEHRVLEFFADYLNK